MINGDGSGALQMQNHLPTATYMLSNQASRKRHEFEMRRMTSPGPYLLNSSSQQEYDFVCSPLIEEKGYLCYVHPSIASPMLALALLARFCNPPDSQSSPSDDSLESGPNAILRKIQVVQVQMLPMPPHLPEAQPVQPLIFQVRI